MIPILAKQAVIIKCQAHSGIIISNYECAYAMGMLEKILGVPMTELEPEAALSDALERLLSEAASYQPADEKEEQLLQMLKAYKPDETMDGQILQLLKMGYEEKELWKR